MDMLVNLLCAGAAGAFVLSIWLYDRHERRKRAEALRRLRRIQHEREVMQAGLRLRAHDQALETYKKNTPPKQTITLRGRAQLFAAAWV